jgi:hypothetical protein
VVAKGRTGDNGVDDLELWIERVKHRLARGELAELEPMPVGGGFPPLPGELFVRVMLADYEHYNDLSPERRWRPETIVLRAALLADLRRLRAVIG